MSRSCFFLFSIWFLLIPFSFVIRIFTGVTSIDKNLAPMLIVLGIVLSWRSLYSVAKAPKKLLLILIAFGFFFIRNISFIGNPVLYAAVMWEDAIKLGYFSLPILYVDSLAKTKTACKLISINAMVGCISAFLVAVGLLTLPYERVSQSRIGIDYIQKSIGLMTSYGDMAQYSAYFLLLAFYLPSNLSFGTREKSGKLLKILAVVIATMGFIGCQSRSFLLTLIIAFVMALLINSHGGETKYKVFYNMMVLSLGIIMIGIVAYLYSDIISFISAFGGSQAQETAMGRLHQYQYAFDLFKESPVFGVNAAYFTKYSENIHGIHNMWIGQAVRGGFISILVLLGLLFSTFPASFKFLNYQEKKPYGVVSIGYVSAVFVSILFYPADSSLFWALLGMNASIVTTLRLSWGVDT